MAHTDSEKSQENKSLSKIMKDLCLCLKWSEGKYLITLCRSPLELLRISYHQSQNKLLGTQLVLSDHSAQVYQLLKSRIHSLQLTQDKKNKTQQWLDLYQRPLCKSIKIRENRQRAKFKIRSSKVAPL